MSNEPTIQDVLEAIHGLSSHNDDQFSDIDVQFKEVRQDISRLDNKIDRVESRLDNKIDLVKCDMMTEIDRFMILHQKLDLELVSMRSRCDRIEGLKR